MGSPKRRFYADNPADYERALSLLKQGTGPVAVDTERASGFRYDDRAFLIQVHRRGTGTILIDPEDHRPTVAEIFAPILNSLNWVIHAAISDLPCLKLLNLHPAELFDTEVAGRLLNKPRVNLAALTSEMLGVDLAKGHGGEDWSIRPLPKEWLNYAAEDVEYLLELAETLTEELSATGKLEIAREEFEFIRTQNHKPVASTWRDVKGSGDLSRPEQKAVLRHLWAVRETLGREKDRAVTRVLPTKTMVDLARQLPKSRPDLRAIAGGNRLRGERANRWLKEVAAARRITVPGSLKAQRGSSSKRFQDRTKGGHAPSSNTWAKYSPDSWEFLQEVRELIDQLSTEIDIPVENILQPSLLRDVVWAITETGEITRKEQVPYFLARCGARNWQVSLTSGLISQVCF